MSDDGEAGAPRSAIARRLEEIRLWLQKQADECRQSAEQIEGRIRVGRAFDGDVNVAAHNRKNQQFFQTKADTISEADAALRACAEARPSTDLLSRLRSILALYDPPVRRDVAADRMALALRALIASAETLAPPEPGWQPIATAPKDGTIIDVWLGHSDADDVEFYCTKGSRRSPAWQYRQGKFRPHSSIGTPVVTIVPTHWMPLPAPPPTPKTS